MDEKDKIIDRINHIIDVKGYNVASFAKETGIKDQTLRNSIVQRKNKPGFDVLYAICNRFDWLDANWLITGKGEMTKKSAKVDYSEYDAYSLASENGEDYQSDSIFDKLKKDIDTARETIDKLATSNNSLSNTNARLIHVLLQNGFSDCQEE